MNRRAGQRLDDFFLPPDFLPPDLRPPEVFLPLRLRGTLAPFFLASDNPIAIACLRLLTLPPFPPRPDFSVPFFRRRIALPTLFEAALPYFLPEDFRAAMSRLLLEDGDPIPTAWRTLCQRRPW